MFQVHFNLNVGGEALEKVKLGDGQLLKKWGPLVLAILRAFGVPAPPLPFPAGGESEGLNLDLDAAPK